ncbi:MAG TPA: lactate racemase domain-containing protein [Gemmataceae bacterium]|nr:lactate racemase domain-containing protein [Gemmataceae bacterium]
MAYPRMLRLRQNFPRPRVENIPAAVRDTLTPLNLGAKIKRGQTVALTAGSRGIANIALILKSTVQHLRDLGAQPFLVPAMGSHGGATAEGQIQVLHSYGITEEFVGAPIRSSMDVIHLGDTPEGWPCYLDKNASTADHIGVVARIKPHTSYSGPVESGLLKMMMIGLGKRHGAAHYHRVLLEQPYDPVVRAVSKVMRAKAPIAFGLAAVENGYDETALIEACAPAEFEPVEERLLVKAKEWLGRLPFHEADLLIIDEIGKDVSGSGMDTNVVGRKRALRSDTIANQPNMRFIFLRGLTEHTHGNACGIGFADFCTTRLVKAMDYHATRINCVTSGYPEGANISVHFDTDREVLDNALAIIGTRKMEDARIIHIKNTLMLAEVEVSEPCMKELKPTTKFDVIKGPYELTFGADGNIAAV